MKDQMIPVLRHSILEEIYFTWSMTPLYGSDGSSRSKILGFFNIVHETTDQVISNRRTETMRRLDEENSLSRTTGEFWQGVLRGLAENHFDVPLAILYSIVDQRQPSHIKSGSPSSRLLSLEGTLGVPENHPAVPPHLDLKDGREGVGGPGLEPILR